jgi:hypothetical protein
MARYRRIETGTWTDQKYVELSAPPPNGRTLWHYLLTGQRTTIFPGLVLAKEIVMAADLEWPIDGHAATLRTAWAEIETRDMAIADWRTGVVVLPRALLDRRGEVREPSKPSSPNAFRGWARAWDDVPDCDLKAWYLAELGRFAMALDKIGKPGSAAYSDVFSDAFATPLQRVRDAYPDAFETRTPTRSRRVQGDMFSMVNAFETRTPTRLEPTRIPVPVSEESEIPLDRGLVSSVAPPFEASDPSGPRVERVLPGAAGVAPDPVYRERLQLGEATWKRLNDRRRELAVELGLESPRDLHPQLRGRVELQNRITEAPERAAEDIEHVFAVAEAQARISQPPSLQFFSGSMFVRESWDRKLGMSLADADGSSSQQRRTAVENLPGPARRFRSS